ncbi:hypothetical protein D9758_004052 [Tetrapyrgos nigripes]|uniref:Mitochondrial import inner membrane translocase subunit n=1 Tax=Tetrapyrgos nigripes TaxID=182062 RepID=A0A8H5GLQ8_9AGAR|nr:hypothetical protein D9758_004052 [Tetrapyrgos nigripes]
MSDFFKNAISSPTDANARKEAIMTQVRTELAQANAQQLVNNMNERCYKACITKPGTSLSGSEETCLARCLDRFMDAFNIVSRTYTARITKERLEESSSSTFF